MNKTIEEIFLETKAVFLAQAEEEAKAAMDKIYDEYLPYVGTDTDSNVYFKAHDLVKRFFEDNLYEGGKCRTIYSCHTQGLWHERNLSKSFQSNCRIEL